MDFLIRHCGNLGNLKSTAVKNGDVDHSREIIVSVGANLCIGAFRGKQFVPFFPNTNGVRLDTAQNF
jgi:hypothetical protein